MDQNTATPSEGQAQPSLPVESTPRLKRDIAWKYVNEVVGAEGKRAYNCNFCQKTFHGGGITRLKHHLAGRQGNIQACKKVPGNVKYQMNCSLQENNQRANEKRSAASGSSESEVIELDGVDSNPEMTNHALGKRKALDSSNLQSYFKLGMNDPSQPSIKACMQSKERWHDTDLAVCMWLYDACIPLNALNSPFFAIAMSKVASMGHGYYGPSYHAALVTLLKDAKASVKLIVDSHRQFWAENGCTIMGDGWKDSRQRPLINFLVYCVKGISFIKSVDASGIETNAENLCNLFSEIVEIVGPENVVHMVTDNATNYKAAGALLCKRYSTISWSPCAAHCINLIMKDIAEIDHVADVVTLATRVTAFLYNHKYTLNWLRKRPGWTEIIRPGDTHFGTTFIALESLHYHKEDLQAFVTSLDYKKVMNLPKAKDVKLTILDERFWNNCLIIVKVMGPLLRLLRICDSDNNPALGYVYEGMHRAKKGIKELFRNNKRLYKPYTTIIKNRWDRMLRKSLHATAYWLNPAFQFDRENFCSKGEVFNGVLDFIEHKIVGDAERVFLDLNKFSDRHGAFSRPMAYATRKKTRPDEWWKAFGGDVPALQKFAVRILSQTASSSGCERNWSVFERIHTKRRNRLEHERLNDLVYVHHNLRLQNRGQHKRIYDPVDYESIDKTESWIVEDVQEEELDYDDIENMLDEHPPINNESSTNGNENNEDEVVDEGINLATYERSVGLSLSNVF